MLGVALVLLSGADWLSGQALGVTIVVCTLVWLAFEMRAFTRMRVLVPGAAGPGQGADGGR
ncbi:hypothetical protein GCM10025868_38650 [Angustibacter aerolatus]|uniref:DUF418 domain-containing protein n=1 Tax=Angustibacter aerolatus TaxID=1162965 RepID=A0ABQ6JPF4_9ACTN|nr:hypothetical protein GCM10025868_38650 [Angustibacter aerolatus]